MNEEKLEKLLNDLSDATAEPVSTNLAEEIKQRIPQSLSHHQGRDTIKIKIDLRVSKLTAAAAIILTTLLTAHFFAAKDNTGNGFYQDSKVLMQSIFGIKKSNTLGYLTGDDNGFYYGTDIDTADPNELLMHWILEDGNYKVMFGNLRTEIVTPQKLIELQAKMLHEK